MDVNPYQAPSESSKRVAPRRWGSASSIGPWLLILLVSFLIGAALTPADPFSSLLAAIPVFVAMILARWSGVRAGRREAEQQQAPERSEQA